VPVESPSRAVNSQPLSDSELQAVDRLLDRWLTRCRVSLSAYNDATMHTVVADRRLGVPATALSALVATGVFATLSDDGALGWKIATGITAVVAAVLTALQTFLRLSERAEQFRETARAYGDLRRRIEQARLFPPATRDEAEAVLGELRRALRDAGRGKPNVPRAIWDRAEYKITGSSDARGARAVWLKLRQSLHSASASRGVADRLPEDHAQYFTGLKNAVVVPVTSLRPSVSPDALPDSVVEARRRMRAAAQGLRPRRMPLDVRRDAGELVIIDGNATFAVAMQDGWSSVPVCVHGD
jgi:hypothetical protein